MKANPAIEQELLRLVKLGYSISSEEHPPKSLVEHARLAEAAGFSFAVISDHIHPWIDRQGNSPFVWSTIGAIAMATDRLQLGTGVTCPIMRTPPAIIAHAAATSACLMPDRFFLGVGSGENLNEHIEGKHWPEPKVRLEMLKEALEIIRLLWQGGVRSFRGEYFTVENARIYNLPERLPPIYMAAGATTAAQVAGQISDGLIATNPDRELVSAFEDAGGRGKPRLAQLTVCWSENETEARRTAYEIWPNAAMPSPLKVELPLPEHFEEAARLVTEEKVAERVVCGPDTDRHVEKISEFLDAGFDHVYIHQVGPDQRGFFRFYEEEILPRFQKGGITQGII